MAVNTKMTDTLFEIPQTTEPQSGPTEVTYSALAKFRNCRKAYENRNIRHLVPISAADENLRFGTMIHGCLEKWHGGASIEDVMAFIDQSCVKRNQFPDVKQAWHLARAIMRAYAKTYAVEPFRVIALEKTFTGPIINPETGWASKSFVLSGKVDGIVEVAEPTLAFPAGNYVLENKTASSVDGNYLDKLWTDFQITIYAHYVEQALKIPITGIIYNVLVKAKLQQSAGETHEEFVQRYMEACSKNKSGKSTATRKMPETDEEFAARLDEKYAEPGILVRQTIFLDRSRFPILQAEIWELTKAMLEAKRRGAWYMNTDFCFNYHRPCVYLPLCKSGDNPVLAENLYQVEAPNTELRTETEPIF